MKAAAGGLVLAELEEQGLPAAADHQATAQVPQHHGLQKPTVTQSRSSRTARTHRGLFMNMPPPAIIMSALPKRSRCSSQSSDAGRWYAKTLPSALPHHFSSLVALRVRLVVDGGSDDHG